MPPKSPEEQAKIVAQFRDECMRDGVMESESETAKDDRLLLRFLRARQYNIENAKIMLKDCLKWRASVGGGVGMDEFYKNDNNDPFNYPERDVVFEHWPLFFHKTDKKGRPINIHKFGSINVPELTKHVTPERFTDILTANCELLTREVLPACSKAAGKRIETVLVIVDLKGFGISQFWGMKDFVRTSFQISQDYYPETMGQVAIINSPMTFTTMWSAVKPWLAKETVEKVDILGSNYHDALLKIVDMDALPAELGGTCTCAEHGGNCATSNVGPWMDGRADRRRAWQRGERKYIAVDFDENPSSATVVQTEMVVPEKKASLPTDTTGQSAAPNAPLEAAVAAQLPPSPTKETGELSNSSSPAGVSIDPAHGAATSNGIGEVTATTTTESESNTEALLPPPSTVAPVIIERPLMTLSPEHEEPTAMNGADTGIHADPSEQDHEGEDEHLHHVTSEDSGVDVRSHLSGASHKSAKSRTSSRLSSIFHVRTRSQSRSRGRGREASLSSVGTDEEDQNRIPERKSKFKAAVERVIDKVLR